MEIGAHKKTAIQLDKSVDQLILDISNSNLNIDDIASEKKEEKERKLTQFLKTGADLKTAQGINAEALSAKVNACLISGLARADGVLFDKLAQDITLSPQEQFTGVMDTIETLLNTLEENSTSESYCTMLNELASLLHKGFNPEIGGSESLSATDGWDSKWNDLGGSNDGTSFNSGETDQNRGVAKAFRDMVKFYKDNAAVHFGEDRHVAGRELAAGQITGTIGQLFQDYVLEEDYDLELRELLVSTMDKNGLINASMKSGEGDSDLFSKISAIRTKLRGNPLLAEISPSQVSIEIANELRSNSKTQLLGLIEKVLKQSDLDRNLTEMELDQLTNEVCKHFTESIEHMEHKLWRTGPRGRIGFSDDEFKPLATTLAGDTGVHFSMADQPNRANDQLSDEWAVETLGPDDPDIKNYLAAVTGEQQILKSGSPPINTLHLGSGLEVNLRNLLNPSMLLKDAILDVLKDKSSKKALLSTSVKERLEKALSPPLKDAPPSELVAEYQKIIGGVTVSFNKSRPGQQITLQKFADNRSVAGILYENNVRTLCSISGTTTDIVLAQCALLGEETVRDLLMPLLNNLEGKSPGLDSDPEGKRFREFTTAISSFMQTGGYHSTGEVIGGLFIAARALTCEEKEIDDIETSFSGFEKLIKEFSQEPEKFLSVTEADKEKIDHGQKEFLARFKKVEIERIRRRRKQAESFLD
ncbi:hypothetical protein SCG7086_CR_00020 [Chlamydiales bacterium SCGC AG-110-P3]|nr:hypothetical protein SCG7086_CR_00020 [Chlamydiales bacterium SCGC AG-110-P3]